MKNYQRYIITNLFTVIMTALIILTVLILAPKGPGGEWVEEEFKTQYPGYTVVEIKEQDDVDNIEYFIYYLKPGSEKKELEIWRFMDQGLLSLQFLRSDESYKNELAR